MVTKRLDVVVDAWRCQNIGLPGKKKVLFFSCNKAAQWDVGTTETISQLVPTARSYRSSSSLVASCEGELSDKTFRMEEKVTDGQKKQKTICRHCQSRKNTYNTFFQQIFTFELLSLFVFFKSSLNLSMYYHTVDFRFSYIHTSPLSEDAALN